MRSAKPHICMTCEPYFMCSAKPHMRRCALCDKMDSEAAPHKKCVGCKRVAYCDRVCQKADWKRHKVHCGPIPPTLYSFALG